MSVTVDDERRTRRTTYMVFTVIFVLLAGLSLFFIRSANSSQEAEQKAAQLSSELSAAGLRVPPTTTIVNVLGDNGGATCDNPDYALKRGALVNGLMNGAGGPGMRPIIADNKLLQGQLLIIKVYCPQYLEEFTEKVQDLKLADVAR